ncbi:MAG: hypothetical protein U0230_00660 [Polyangiales bacterium]
MPYGGDTTRPPGRLPRVAVSALALACLAATSLLGCSGGGESPADALALAEPRLGSFDEFDRWARRTLDADPERPGSEAFRELLFSPLQEEPGIAAAWVVREGASPRAWELRDVPSPRMREGWTRVRHASLGPLRIGRFALDDPRTPATDPVETVVIERRAKSSASAWVEVSVAYVLAGP